MAAMWYLIIVVIAVVIAVAMIPVALRQRKGTEPAPTHRSAEIPSPGEPTPEKDGRPVPGSEEDRRRHGKP